MASLKDKNGSPEPGGEESGEPTGETAGMAKGDLVAALQNARQRVAQPTPRGPAAKTARELREQREARPDKGFQMTPDKLILFALGAIVLSCLAIVAAALR